MRTYVTKTDRFASDQKMLLDISDVLGKETLAIGGKKYDARAIEALLHERIDATHKVEPLRVLYLKAVQEERAALDRTDEELADIRTLLLVRFKHQPELLARLGLAPRKKRKKMTGKEIVAMAQKAEQTRNDQNGHPPERIP